jgi:hypothetical protein
MATRKVNALEEEKMTDANIQRVIDLLEPTEEGKQPITKKLACELLGMAYNTTRLGTIINTFKDRKEKDRQRRAEKRGKPASTEEITFTIQEYLEGETIDAISKSLFRSPAFVKSVLDKYNVPIRAVPHDYFDPKLIPEGAMRERFKVGEIVYSARYDSLARIEAEIENSVKHGWVYRCWLCAERWREYCYQPASELASLEHLRELGVKV